MLEVKGLQNKDVTGTDDNLSSLPVFEITTQKTKCS